MEPTLQSAIPFASDNMEEQPPSLDFVDEKVPAVDSMAFLPVLDQVCDTFEKMERARNLMCSLSLRATHAMNELRRSGDNMRHLMDEAARGWADSLYHFREMSNRCREMADAKRSEMAAAEDNNGEKKKHESLAKKMENCLTV